MKNEMMMKNHQAGRENFLEITFHVGGGSYKIFRFDGAEITQLFRKKRRKKSNQKRSKWGESSVIEFLHLTIRAWKIIS
jgi:hypothetical protein